MATPSSKPPDTPAAAPVAQGCDAPQPPAPKKPSGPATPSRLRQVLLADIASSPSRVANADLTLPSPLKGKGKNGNIDSSNGTKRPRMEDDTGEEWSENNARPTTAITDCQHHVAQIVADDRRLYEAKMRLFEECAAAVDKTLERAGSELYAQAKGFGSFFAKCFSAWLENGTVLEKQTAHTGSIAACEKRTYAKVAAPNSHQPQKPQSHQTTERQTRATDQAGQPPNKLREDLRVFVRMDNSRLEPYGVKATLTRRLALNHQELKEVTRCATGFALHPKDKPTQAKLLSFQKEISDILKARKVETHTVWHHYKLAGCPRKVMSAEGLTIDITEITVADEAETQTGTRPVRCMLSQHTIDTDAETTWLVSFPHEVRKSFRLFAHSMASRSVRREPKIPQCEGCFGFHGHNYRCGKVLCPRCGRSAHENDCEKPIPKCVNCRGPHPANTGKCPARPKVIKGTIRRPSWEQLKEIRLAGDRARSQAFNETRQEALAKEKEAGNVQNCDGEDIRMQMATEATATVTTRPSQDVDTIVVCP